MAIKKQYLIAAAAVGLLAGVLLPPAVRWIHIRTTEEGATVASLAAPGLPDDEKLAQRELRKARQRRDALRSSRPYIVIDTNANLLCLRSEDSILLKTPCSTGSGGELVDEATGRKWSFNTPLGAFKVESKLVDPWWRKPDWAFIEDSLAVPADPSLRLDAEMLGEYALGFGNGYYIHGTIYERLLGVSVTHGCVRVGSDDLELLYEKVGIGTRIYIF
jgi:lipoprotein-anchoring transpeptidase ErfK/SrfK